MINNKQNRGYMNNTVRLIGTDGQQLGIMQYILAKREAETQGLDLVEVSKSANPPVFKIMDSGKMKYEENKKAKANVKRGPKQKDIIFKIGIQDNDFKIKVNKITEFLEKGHRVNVSVSLKGRQQYHSDIGVELVQRAIQAAAATYELHDAVISTQGKLISTVLTRK